MSKPTVVIISDHGSVVGGAEKVAFGSALGLLERGYEVHAVIGTGEPDSSLTEAGIQFHRLQRDTYWMEWGRASKFGKLQTFWGDPELKTQLHKTFSAFDPASTVFHFHVFYSFLTVAALDLAVAMGFRCYVTCHDYNIACTSSTFYDSTNDRPCGQRALSVGCYKCLCLGPWSGAAKMVRFGRTWKQHHLSRTLDRVAGFLFVSEKSRTILAPYLPHATPKELLLNPIEVPTEVAATPFRDRPRYLWLGRMVQEKGPLVAAEAARQAGVRLTFGGDGPLMESIKEQYPEHEYLGWVNSERVRTLYAESRAVLMTSQWFETASLVTLDAMAQGVAPIVADITVATDWFEEGVSGRSFRYDNPSALAEVLSDFQDDAYAERLGRAARERFMVNPPTMEKHLDQLETLYSG